MNKIKFFIIAFFSLTFFSCEGPIYHSFEIANNSDENLEIEYSVSQNKDSIIYRTILPDSTAILHSQEEMQGFFSGKVLPVKISETFNLLNILNDTTTNTDIFIDSLWTVKYIPGKYIYTFRVN